MDMGTWQGRRAMYEVTYTTQEEAGNLRSPLRQLFLTRLNLFYCFIPLNGLRQDCSPQKIAAMENRIGKFS